MANLIMPGAWDRPDYPRKPFNVVAAFLAKNGRDPNDSEIACLKRAVDKAKAGIRRGRDGEWEYQHGWFAAHKTINKGRCLTKQEWDDGSNTPRSAGGQSRQLVGYFQAKWKREHPSGFFSWVSHAVSSAVHVISKVAKIALPIAKLIPGVGSIVGGAEIVGQMASLGATAVSANKVLSAGRTLLPPTDHKGFDVGAAIMTAPNLTPDKLAQVRSKLKPQEKRGFDTAVSIQAGMGSVKAPPSMTPTEKAGFYATQGMQHATNSMKRGMLKPIMTNPQARKGVETAALQIADKSLWQHIKEWMGIYPVQSLAEKAPEQRPAKGRGKRA